MHFSQEISLARHYLACYQIEKALAQYFFCWELSVMEEEPKLEMKFLMIDIISCLQEINIPYYEEFDVHDEVYFDISGIEQKLVVMLDKHKWIKAKGLYKFINYIISYDENTSKWDKKLFFWRYDLKSKIRFGSNRNKTLVDLINNDPNELVKLQHEYYHFIIDLDVYFNKKFHLFLTSKDPMLYWQVLGKTIIKMLIQEKIECINSELRAPKGASNDWETDKRYMHDAFYAYETDPPELDIF